MQKLYKLTVASVYDAQIQETSIDKVLAEYSDYELSELGLLRIDPSNSELTEENISWLKRKGWVHPSTLKEVNEKKELEQKFWLYDSNRFDFIELDMGNLTTHQIHKLANGAEIVQKVQTESVLSEDELAYYLAEQEAKKNLEQKKKKAAEKKQAKKKAKEIELAKKILQEAGEI